MRISVFSRIKAFQQSGYSGDITLEDKHAIGEYVAKKFFVGKHVFIYKAKIKEPEGEFSVWMYPDTFIKTIDKIIKSHFIAKGKK